MKVDSHACQCSTREFIAAAATLLLLLEVEDDLSRCVVRVVVAWFPERRANASRLGETRGPTAAGETAGVGIASAKGSSTNGSVPRSATDGADAAAR